jgi:hypothetical protein
MILVRYGRGARPMEKDQLEIRGKARDTILRHLYERAGALDEGDPSQPHVTVYAGAYSQDISESAAVPHEVIHEVATELRWSDQLLPGGHDLLDAARWGGGLPPVDDRPAKTGPGSISPGLFAFFGSVRRVAAMKSGCRSALRRGISPKRR